MQTIEQEIRKAYTGILPEEQIKATIDWWNKKAEALLKEERERMEELLKDILVAINKARKCDIDYLHPAEEKIKQALEL